MNIILDNNKAKYIAIFESIKNLINTNELKSNEKLPSKRALASDLNVSLNTIINAYNLLIDEGYIYSKEKCGYFVTSQKNITYYENKNVIIDNVVNNNYIYDFSTEKINDFNCNNYNKVFKEILATNNYLNKCDILGDINLRCSIKRHLMINRNINVSENQIIIGSGMEMLEDIIKLCDIDNITLENPGYHKLALLNKKMNLKINYQSLDDNGVIPPTYKTILYTTPFNQFPTGIKMSISRKKELAEFVSITNSYIIEDDFDAEFRINASPTTSIFSFIPDKTIFFSTFSTTLFPGSRIAYSIIPSSLVKKYRDTYSNLSNPVSTINQLVLAKFIDEGYYASYLNKKKKEYIKKRELIYSLLDNYKINYDKKRNYLSIIIKLDVNNNDKFKNELEKNKIKLINLSHYNHYNEPSDFYMLGYTALSINEIKEGIEKLYNIYKLYKINN